MAVALISMRPIRSFHRAEILPFRATMRGYDETFLFSRDEIFDRNRDLKRILRKYGFSDTLVTVAILTSVVKIFNMLKILAYHVH